MLALLVAKKSNWPVLNVIAIRTIISLTGLAFLQDDDGLFPR